MRRKTLARKIKWVQRHWKWQEGKKITNYGILMFQSWGAKGRRSVALTYAEVPWLTNSAIQNTAIPLPTPLQWLAMALRVKTAFLTGPTHRMLLLPHCLPSSPPLLGSRHTDSLLFLKHSGPRMSFLSDKGASPGPQEHPEFRKGREKDSKMSCQKR